MSNADAFTTARAWLHNYLQSHQRCRVWLNTSNKTKFSPTRPIDVADSVQGNVRLNARKDYHPQRSRYATLSLSYCRGGTSQ